MKNCKLNLGGICFIFVLFFYSIVSATPICPIPMEVTQPNGTTITVRTYGDEFFSWQEDEQGNVITYDEESNSYKYAELKDGKIVPTSQTVGEISLFSVFTHRINHDDIIPLWENADRVDYSQNYDGMQLMSEDDGVAKEPTPLTHQKLLTVLIEFNDVNMMYSADFWREQMFSTEPDALSVVNYWKENSNGLDIFEPADTSNVKVGRNGVVSCEEYSNVSYEITECSEGVVRVSLDMPHPIKQWSEQNRTETGKMVTLAIRAIEEDYNFVSEKSHVVVIFAGYSMTVSFGDGKGQIAAHAGITGVETTEGYNIGKYAALGELLQYDIPEGIGTICHELGHSVFNLPDLYFSNLPEGGGGNNGIGSYSLMSLGAQGRRFDYKNVGKNNYKDKYAVAWGHVPAHLDAWSKIKCGFAAPTVVTNWEGNINSISNLGENSQYNILKIRSKADTKQYYLIENRQLIGFDKGLETLNANYHLGTQEETYFTGGILIYHIDENVDYNFNNNSIEHSFMHIEHSNIINSDKAEASSWAYLDTEGRNKFNVNTVPNSNFHTVDKLKSCTLFGDCHPQTVSSGISVEVLSASSPTMNVNVNVDDEYIVEETGETFSDIFPDINFCNTVIEMLEEDGAERKTVDIISADDWVKIMSAEGLEVDGRDIKDLSGIEHFSRLEELDCSSNEITRLDISNNTQLMYLNCNNNKVTELNVSDCQNLLWLYCENNLLKNLDISSNKELNWLYCSGNELTKLDISNNSDLTRLLCYDNYMDENPERAIIGLENNIEELGEAGSKDKKTKFTYYPQKTAATQTPTPTVTPTIPPELSDRIEFVKLDNVISAKLIFEKTTPPNENDIWLIVAYKQNGELKHVEIPPITDMTAGFVIPPKYKDCEIILYVWDKNMKPLMGVQRLDI